MLRTWLHAITQQMLDACDIRPGARVLDVAAGAGDQTLDIAARVGPAGGVVASDISPRILALARQKLQRAGFTRVTTQVADAEALPLAGAEFDAEFDAAVCRLGLMFCTRPQAALAGLHAALRPGGRLGVATFGPRDALWEDLDDVFTPFVPQGMLDARTSGTRGPFARDAGIEELITNAGFTGARTVRRDQTVRFVDVAQWHRWSRSHGQRMFWEAVPSDQQGAVLAASADRLEAARDGDGFTLTQQVRYTMAATPR